MNFSLFLFQSFCLSICTCANISESNFELQQNGNVFAETNANSITTPLIESKSFEETKSESQETQAVKIVDNEMKIIYLPEEVILLIAEYLKNPVTSLGSINMGLYKLFHEKFTLKHYVSQRLDLIELPDIDDNEPELAGILDLTWCQSDPYFLFGALMEDLDSGKKFYRALIPQLIPLLQSSFLKIDEGRKKEYRDRYGNSFDPRFGSFYVFTRNYDKAFEYLNDYPAIQVNYFMNSSDRKGVMEFLKSDESMGIRFKDIFMSRETKKDPEFWISDCLIFDAPDVFFIDILIANPRILEFIIKPPFITRSIPESEYPRIHAKICELLKKYFKERENWEYYLDKIELKYLFLVNEVLFGSESLENFEFDRSNFDQISFVATAAFFRNKTDLLRELLDPSLLSYFISKYIIPLLKSAKSYVVPFNCLKLIFESIITETGELTTYYKFDFIMKYYALKGGSDNDCFELVASNDLLDHEVPPLIFFELRDDGVMKDFLSHMRIVNEGALLWFISVKENYYRQNNEKSFVASIEVIDVISKSPALIEKFLNLGIKLQLRDCYEDFEKYLDLPSCEETCRIIVNLKSYFHSIVLLRLESRKHIEVFEKIFKTSVAEQFLKYESDNMPELLYFEWRLAFSYWINGSLRERIREIKNQKIIKLLRFEFPKEMDQLLGPEQSFFN